MTPEEFRAEMDARLDLHRPDRYHEDDQTWMVPVLAWAQDQLDRDRALRRALEREEQEV
jgi:hypothetical protein